MKQQDFFDMCWIFVLLIILRIPCYICGNSEPIAICSMQGCNCNIIVHHWINIKCTFSDDQDIELYEGSIPSDVSEISVSHCRELRIHSGALTGGVQLKRILIKEIHSVVASKQAFYNISSPNPLLEVSECNRLVLESHAFKNVQGTLSISISRCKFVEIKPNAFSWLLRFKMTEVSNLELSSNAFKFDASFQGRHGPATEIAFQNVNISEIPSSAFPSAAAEIRIDDVRTHVIRKNAFCAVTIHSIKISNASIMQIESGAFSEHTLILNFELIDVQLTTIKSGAFRAAATNFTILYSRFDEIETEAFEVSAATITFNYNEFRNLQKRSMIFKEWSHISIDYNGFLDIGEDAIIVDKIAKATPEYPHLEFTLRGNHIGKAVNRSLRFAIISKKVNVAKVGDNYFEQLCSCSIENWMEQVIGDNTSVAWLMESNECIAGEWLEKCFKIPKGYIVMRNFTDKFCQADGIITCKDQLDDLAPTVISPSIGPHIYSRKNSVFDIEMSDSERLEREKVLIFSICIIGVLSGVAILIIFGVSYIRRRNMFSKFTPATLNVTHSWLSATNEMTGALSVRSLSRSSVNEYAGANHSTRILDVGTQELENDLNDDFVYTENKATQTLPEELTEDYLKDLRNQLNDPENYSQARDMIEHLYDLIKIEENCNNNNELRTSINGEHTYDIIAPRIRRSRTQKPSINVGTKVPSLENLLFNDQEPALLIAEYTQPKDQQIGDRNHLYAELPGDETVPSTSRLSQPVWTNVACRAPQPFPPDVINDHLIARSLVNEFSTEISKDNSSKEAAKDQQQVVNFFEDSRTKPARSSLWKHRDTINPITHIYSEVPESRNISAATVSKMANRPLPVEPNQESRFSET